MTSVLVGQKHKTNEKPQVRSGYPKKTYAYKKRVGKKKIKNGSSESSEDTHDGVNSGNHSNRSRKESFDSSAGSLKDIDAFYAKSAMQ